MSEMVERVAKIIHDEIENDDDSDGGAYLRAARAVLKALREPTADMLKQGNAGLSWNGETYWRESITDAWQYMIDEALGEQP